MRRRGHRVPPPDGCWRRGWDSNPRRVAPYTISSRACSATPAPLRAGHMSRPGRRPQAGGDMLAERVGFEPTRLIAYRFSRAAPSTTRTPLRLPVYQSGRTSERYPRPGAHVSATRRSRRRWVAKPLEWGGLPRLSPRWARTPGALRRARLRTSTARRSAAERGTGDSRRMLARSCRSVEPKAAASCRTEVCPGVRPTAFRPFRGTQRKARSRRNRLV